MDRRCVCVFLHVFICVDLFLVIVDGALFSKSVSVRHCVYQNLIYIRSIERKAVFVFSTVERVF